MSNESAAVPPFADTLKDKENVDEGAFASIKEFTRNPDWVVKELDQVHDEAREDWLWQAESGVMETPPAMTFERFSKEVGVHKKILDASNSGIRSYIPTNHIVYGHNEHGEETGFIIMQKVQGTDIQRISEISPEQLEDLEQLIVASLDFYEESKASPLKGADVFGYLPDLVTSSDVDPPEVPDYDLHNIIIGRIAGTEAAKPYLVDTYPLRAIYNSDNDSMFDHLKEALTRFEEQTNTNFSAELTSRLAKYGTRVAELA